MLLAIADNANDEGICWPSTATLAFKCRTEERAAQTLLAKLESQGDIYRQQVRGRTHSNRFCLVSALYPQEARRSLTKWFGMKSPQVNAILKKVQVFAPIAIDERNANSRDPFEEKVQELAREAHVPAEKRPKLAPITSVTVSNIRERKKTAATAHSKSNGKSKPNHTTAAAADRVKEIALSLYAIFEIEEPSASMLARMPHLTNNYVRGWSKYKTAADRVRAERKLIPLGPGFYVSQMKAKKEAPPPPTTQDDFDNIVPRQENFLEQMGRR